MSDLKIGLKTFFDKVYYHSNDSQLLHHKIYNNTGPIYGVAIV